ncbi:lipase family protein [Gordonia neofelifaecis]|uniref:Secretory lipase family protein n=1 Tax=Gordonia neofelifaecis NRRL B-59395 TaxID=644548 RepID=F1YJW7_9ACTN|nr:lipase family protein [Gordonia neofelifaecis]EGD55049.1 secretory lipase family protein [Gordonia neofelifaecis NRRL B-59395]
MTASIRPPELDHFYRFPDDPDDPVGVAPGSVLRRRSVNIGSFGGPALPIRADQLLYRTSDRHGVAECAVTTVLRPSAPAVGVLSFQCAVDAVTPRALPSYGLRSGSRAAGSLAHLELPQIVAALRRGWTVSVPDHCGRRGRLGAPREPGHRALDAVRAVYADDAAGSLPPHVGLWGYSGGGLATLWAAETARIHAPELTVVGAVAGAPVGDLAATFKRLNGGRFAGFVMVFLAGLLRAYPELDAVVDDHARPELRTSLSVAATLTPLAALMRFALFDVGDHLEYGLDGLLRDPRLAAVLAEIRPGESAPAVPLLVQQGERDEVIAVSDVAALVGRYRALGVEVEYQRSPFGWHLPLSFWTARAALDWLGHAAAAATASAA